MITKNYNFNDFTYSIWKKYNEKIFYLTKYNPERREECDKRFNDFLDLLHKKTNEIIKYCNSDNKKNNLKISLENYDYVFCLIVYKDLRTKFLVKMSYSIEADYDKEFISKKLKPHYGYVYFLKSQFGFKIGFTTSLTKRMKTFDVKLPFNVELHSTIKTEEYRNIEKTLHNILQLKNINGEWFEIDDNDFIELDKIIVNMGLQRVPFNKLNIDYNAQSI